jgi:endo-1,4-beta-xylanase
MMGGSRARNIAFIRHRSYHLKLDMMNRQHCRNGLLTILLLFSLAPESNAQPAETLRVEQEYLSRAHASIEKHRKGDAVLTFLNEEGIPLQGLHVDVDQTTQDFRFGNLLFELARFGDHDHARDELYRERFTALFNYGVLPFYWSAYERAPGKPRWEANQAVAEWCSASGIICKGHPLGWTHPAGTPDWFLELTENDAWDVYKARILNTVAGFRGAIDIWDVVNEPVNTVPLDFVIGDTAAADHRIGEGNRYDVRGIRLDQVLPWVEKSFRWAFQANPRGDFILNEFSQIAVPEVRERFYSLVEELQRRGVPVTGIGVQGHEPREMWYSPVELYATLDRYAGLDLPIHITEFIPQSSGKGITGGWREGRWTEQAQADFAIQFYTLAFGHPSVVSITWWGLSDANIWLEGGGLLDKEHRPKPVYDRLRKLIREEWMTRGVSLSTDDRGVASFRGFFGRYEVTVTAPDGSVTRLEMHLGEGEDNHREFRI